MNKIQAMLVLLLALVLGGAVAQTAQPRPGVLPALQGALPTLQTLILPAGLVLPAGVELSDEELVGVEGKLNPFVVIAAVYAANKAVKYVRENPVRVVVTAIDWTGRALVVREVACWVAGC